MRSNRERLRFVLAGICAAGLALPANASGPRFVTGPPYFTGQDGVAIGWRQANLLYFTDAGDLSAAVNHQAADAMVAAAAGVWNVPVASITVGQGGVLAEHVSGQNTYLSSTGMVFPAEVMSGNAAAMPIAVIYDSDGSVTDTLLGAGASDPSGCRQNSVTESVDRFDPAGYIVHAVIVLNGRCTGTVPELQLEMRYKLERVFGRVLGLAWSQTNDNVFTGTPQPSYGQALNWPIMHPIDIICGPYSYQCLPNPFQLRADDVAGMVALYPIAQGATVAAGKQASLASASRATVYVGFPTGEGMAGVNVLVRRQAPQAISAEGWYETSTVTGMNFRRAGRSPFVAADASALGSMGSWNQGWLGQYGVAYVPVPAGEPYQNVLFSTEAVNSLYMGQYSLGPYALGTVTPSGSSPVVQPVGVDAQWGYAEPRFVIGDAAQACSDGSDGTTFAPMAMPATGWWTGVLCGYRHASYAGWDVKPGRTLTVEVTALDEQGLGTVHKAMPVIGLFAPTDGNDGLPTQGLAETAFNARGVGTTTLTAATGTATHLRLGIADERGDGRPDFRYQARVLYADNVLPGQLGTAGGNLTISGLGFRAGNAVAIHGVTVPVTSWTANTLVLRAPAMAAVNATAGSPLDVTVTDLSTGATSTISGALTYTSSPGAGLVMKLISAPTGTVPAGTVVGTAFAVQVLAADGQTPAAGQTVVFTTTGGTVTWAACGGSSSCSLMTDAQGMAASGVTPQGPGTVTLQATSGTQTQHASMTVVRPVGSMVLVTAPSGGQPITTTAATPFAVQVLDTGGAGIYLVPVQFTVTAGSATFSGCFSQPCTVLSDGSGAASVQVTPTALGPVTVQASALGKTQRAMLTGTSDDDVMRTVSTPATQIYTGDSAGVFLISLTHVDGATPDTLQPIVFTAPAGIRIAESGTTTMTRLTDGGGYIGVQLVGTKAGTYVVTAAFGSVQQSISITVRDHTLALQIVSAPSGAVPVGVQAGTPFAVRLLQDGVTPITDAEVGLGGAQDAWITDACGLGTCNVMVDSSGTAMVMVTPKKPGQLTLSASYEQLVETVTVMVTGPQETLRVVTQPGPAGVAAGDAVTLGVQAIGTDGTTVYPNKALYFSVVSGPFALTVCQLSTCGGMTDENGVVSMFGVALGSGPVVVQVVSEDLQQTITFNSASRPDVVRLVSAPGSGGYAGTAATVAFAVQVMFADGVTTAPGKNVTLSVTNGAAGLAACGGLTTCVVPSNANGVVSTTVTPLSAGVITLMAAEGGVSATATFTARAVPEVMQVVSVPANGSAVGQAATPAFAVRMVSGDASGSGLAGRTVTLSVTNGSATLGSCGAASCVVLTDGTGLAQTTVTALAAGTVGLLATEGTLTQAVSFSAALRPDTMTILSVPGDGAVTGAESAVSFAVKVTESDGVTAAVGRAVTLAVTSALGRLSACGAPSCVLTTDAAGRVSSGVVPLAAGLVTLRASEDTPVAIAQSVSFHAALPPDVLTLASGPGASVYVGASSAKAFAVKLVQGDGVTAEGNVRLTFQASSAGVSFAGCGVSPCVMLTDGNGMAGVTVIGVTPGAVTLTAMADSASGAGPVTLPFQVLANDYRVAMTPAARWVAEGATLQSSVAVSAVLNGNAASGVGVQWSVGTGTRAAGTTSVTDVAGAAAMPVTVGPLGAGAQGRVTACAWTTECADALATGVGAGEMQIALVAGAGQTANGNQAYTPVSVRVTDGAGHPVAAASVSIYQTVLAAAAAACPGHGRCPAAAALATKTTVVVCGEDGMVNVQPLTADALEVESATETQLVFTVGTQGFVSTTLNHAP